VGAGVLGAFVELDGGDEAVGVGGELHAEFVGVGVVGRHLRRNVGLVEYGMART
jgi:hypothetical protein